MVIRISGIGEYPRYKDMKLNHIQKSAVQNPVSKKENNYFNNYISFAGIRYEPNIHPVQYIDKYITYDVVKNALDTNPDIPFILKINQIEPEISLKNIDNRLKLHMLTTYFYAKEIANQYNLDLEQKEILYKASLLHDIGKALIPEEIIQKPGRLTQREREIIDLHARLGYEILKTTDIDTDTLEVVKLHHIPAYKKTENILAQILSVADVYSALKEERVYKLPMANHQAFEIMSGDEALSQNFVEMLKTKFYND